MTYRSPYGKAEGLPERIGEWIERLKDPILPWVGLGLIDDLKAVQRNLGQSVIESEVSEQVGDL